MRKVIIAMLAVVLFSVTVSAQQATEKVELDNGATVFVLSENNGMSAVVLQCAFPRYASNEFYADVALINRLIWHGVEGPQGSIMEHEYKLIAQRFGGSITSRLLHDGFVVSYSIPEELVIETLRQISLQWTALSHDSERLEQIKQQVIAQESYVQSQSVERQLRRELERRIWSDLPYYRPVYGSADALETAYEARIDETFKHLSNPANWTITISGVTDKEQLLESLGNTIGALPGTEFDEEQIDVALPRMGQTLQLPAELSRNWAIVAFRLPAATDINVEQYTLYTELVRRSPQLAALVEDLRGTENLADVTVDMDARKYGSLLTFSASWSGDEEATEVLERLRFLASSVDGKGQSANVLASARKAELIRLWSIEDATGPYAAWLNRRSSIGAGVDIPAIAKIISETADCTAITEQLTKENSLALITVEK